MVPVFEVDEVSAGYQSMLVLDNVSLSFAKGELVSIIGPNGAGKTTLISVMSGELPIWNGCIRYNERDITKAGFDARARMGIGRSFQRTNLFPGLSALENVVVAVQARRRVHIRQMLQRRDRSIAAEADTLLTRVGLSQLGGTRAAELAHGDKRKLEMAMLLALKPEILLLDEPTAGMSMEETKVILALVTELRQSRKYTIVLVEHKLDVVMRLSDTVAVLHQGSVLATGKPEEVMHNPKVEEAYLGGYHGNRT
ncbi:ABC transporter ATP-binding protein [Alicyclobacillus sp. SO9]|uniref:ABC transporter ATP-binding protein n=1 Tax=Alicyclobacillus sp. SO9 TaxID=2665646 RepID=UPI0018E82CC7|nr:ABC transporter ATP-binding protein [Alicyclobacillus sp. SO9]QQE77518.1 ABC transporter ATP-binding protein [Alicyclobacillus sp. SO9]